MVSTDVPSRVCLDGKDTQQAPYKALNGTSVSTLQSWKRFVPNAETLSPYPDGVRLQTPQVCMQNYSLMKTRTVCSAGMKANVASCLKGASVCHGNFSCNRSVSGFGGRRPNTSVAQNDSSSGYVNDCGYWSLTFVTAGGEDICTLKARPPTGRGCPSFESIVDIINDNAKFLDFTVLYITYLDMDFGTYVLLTPQTVGNGMDAFRVVVESPGMFSGPPKKSHKLEDSSEEMKGASLCCTSHEVDSLGPISKEEDVSCSAPCCS